MKVKVLVLIGTRPEAIKLAPVIFKLKSNPENFETRICATGQHDEMLYQAFSDFDIDPDLDLKVMRPGQSLGSVTARLFEAIDAVLEAEKPNWVLVQGDTATAMVGAICGFYRKIKVGHVEAGLRSHNRFSPFPEEMNRKVASIVADKHFAPTEGARQNLLREGIRSDDILVTGNTVVDALLWMIDRVRDIPPIIPTLILEACSENKRIVLITGHRRESFGAAFEQICLAIRDLASLHTDTNFIYPVHFNPMVRQPVMSILGGVDLVILTEPLSYQPFVWLMNRSNLILTDSGGIQEEAPSLGKPVFVMRDVTERPEGVEAGTSHLVGSIREDIVKAVSWALDQKQGSPSNGKFRNPYGDGLAAKRIVQALLP